MIIRLLFTQWNLYDDEIMLVLLSAYLICLYDHYEQMMMDALYRLFPSQLRPRPMWRRRSATWRRSYGRLKNWRRNWTTAPLSIHRRCAQCWCYLVLYYRHIVNRVCWYCLVFVVIFPLKQRKLTLTSTARKGRDSRFSTGMYVCTMCRVYVAYNRVKSPHWRRSSSPWLCSPLAPIRNNNTKEIEQSWVSPLTSYITSSFLHRWRIVPAVTSNSNLDDIGASSGVTHSAIRGKSHGCCWTISTFVFGGTGHDY